MTTTVKFLLDENIPPSIVHDLDVILKRAKVEDAAQVKHVHALYAELGLESTQGNWDEVWIPEFADKGWVVLAADLGKTSGKGKKLPSLCVQYGITHILLSPAVHGRQKFRKLLTILSVWHQLIAIASGAPGSRHHIEPLSGAPGACASGKIVAKAIPLSEPPPPGLLFRKN